MTTPATARRNGIFVLALTALYLALALCWQDISCYDETFYMESGTIVTLRSFVTHLQFAPLYAMWYRLLHLVCPWPVWRYFLSWATLVAVALLLPAAMRLRSAWVYAWLLVCVPFLGPSSLSITPYVNLFAACLLLLGACLIRGRNLTLLQAAFVAFLACFVVSFARPEFAFFVPVLALVYLVVYRRALRSNPSLPTEKHTRFQSYTVLALSLFMLVILRHGGGSRSGIAFAQHFNVRAMQNHLLPPQINPWVSDYALRVFHLDPGNTAATTTATIFRFMAANPRLFAQHIFANLTTPLTWVSCLLLLLALAAPMLALRAPGRSRSVSAVREQHLGPMALYIGLVCLPALTSILLIFPDQHYFFTLLPVVLLYTTELLAGGRAKAAWQPWLLAAALPIMLLTTIGWPSLKEHRVLLPHPVRDSVACLQDLQRVPTASSGLIYDALGIAPVLIGAPRPHTEMWDIIGWPNFQAWVSYNHPAWVEINPAVATFYGVPRSQVDAYLRQRGYTPHTCPAIPEFTPTQVYIAAR